MGSETVQAFGDVHDGVLTSLLDTCPGDAPAVLTVDTVLDYESLADAVHYLASTLQMSGVRRGARVGLLVSGASASVIALCALGDIAASVVVLDPTATPDVLSRQMGLTEVELLLADVGAELALDEVVDRCRFGELAVVVAGEYSLVRVADTGDCRSSEVVFFDDATPSSWRWGELFDAARSVRSESGLGVGSTVSVLESLTAARTVTALFVAFVAGSAVSLSEPFSAPRDPYSIAAQLHDDAVTVLFGSVQYLEGLVRSGAVGLLPIPSLVDVVALDGELDAKIVAAIAAAMPSVTVRYSETRQPESATRA